MKELLYTTLLLISSLTIQQPDRPGGLQDNRLDKEVISQIPVPPTRFQEDVLGGVHFARPERVNELCKSKLEKGKILLGCSTQAPPQMALPNPCNYRDELYARIACHELGHMNGWTSLHEQ